MPPRPPRNPQPRPVTPIVRDLNACPHCRAGVLEETTASHRDSAGKQVTVWECDNLACDYTEGR